LPSEHSIHSDPATGIPIHQLTAARAISHPPYFLQSSFTRDGCQLFFTSYRTGSAQLFVLDYPDGEVRQLTNGDAVHPYSAALHPDQTRIFYVEGHSIRSVPLTGGEPQILFSQIGAQFGECSIDPSGDWVVTAIKAASQSGLLVLQLSGGQAHQVPFPRTVIHPQFHPLEPDWIEFAADPAPRMHRVRRDGSGLECLYQHGNDEFVVHETFLGQTGDLVFTVWPYSLRRMDWTNRRIQTITDLNAWHIAPNRAGTEILCDTNHPDLGLFRIDVATGRRTLVCLTQSSNQGSQWRKSSYALAADFAAAQSAAKSGALSWMEVAADTVYGPQWTHPHPAYSADEKRVTFASDRTGVTQVYCADLP